MIKVYNVPCTWSTRWWMGGKTRNEAIALWNYNAEKYGQNSIWNCSITDEFNVFVRCWLCDSFTTTEIRSVFSFEIPPLFVSIWFFCFYLSFVRLFFFVLFFVFFFFHEKLLFHIIQYSMDCVFVCICEMIRMTNDVNSKQIHNKTSKMMHWIYLYIYISFVKRDNWKNETNNM